MNHCIVFVSGLNYFINNRVNQEKRESVAHNNRWLIWVKIYCVPDNAVVQSYITYKGTYA